MLNYSPTILDANKIDPNNYLSSYQFNFILETTCDSISTIIEIITQIYSDSATETLNKLFTLLNQYQKCTNDDERSELTSQILVFTDEVKTFTKKIPFLLDKNASKNPKERLCLEKHIERYNGRVTPTAVNNDLQNYHSFPISLLRLLKMADGEIDDLFKIAANQNQQSITQQIVSSCICDAYGQIACLMGTKSASISHQ